MPKNSQKKFLIVAELDRKGFMLKIEDSLKKAMAFSERTFMLSKEFCYDDMYKIEYKLNPFAKYEVSGNVMCLSKFKSSTTNGFYSVTVVEIELKNLKMFIRERENLSIVFDYDLYDEEISRLIELFPAFDMFAN